MYAQCGASEQGMCCDVKRKISGRQNWVVWKYGFVDRCGACVRLGIN